MMKYLKICLAALLLFLCLAAVSCSKDPCADGHLYEEWKTVKKQTCGTDGERSSECARCGTVCTEVLPATGEHRPSAYYVKTPATLFTTGEKVQQCQKCKQEINPVQIPAIADSISVERSDSTVALDLSSCAVIYDDTAEYAAYTASAAAVQDALARYTGRAVALCPFSAADGISVGCKIFIGACNTPQVQQVQTQLSGNGFVLSAQSTVLVILGNNDMQTMRAAQYFADVCVPQAGNGTSLVLPALARARNAAITTLASKDGFAFDLVYSRELDNNPAHKYVAGDEDTDSRDYPCVAAEQLAKDIASLLGTDAGSISVHNDNEPVACELLIGTLPNRPEAESFRTTLDGHEYGILVHDGKVILTAHNDVALAACISHFLELLARAECDGGGGKTVYALPDGFCVRVSVENEWITDFLRPAGAGITLYNTQYNNDGSLQYYYTGEGVTQAAYQTYCAQLLGAGYRQLAENAIEGSLFKTFVQDAEGITLYVAYNDYKYESNYAKDDEYDVDFEKCIRVISAPLDSVTLPDAGLLTPAPTYTKVADTTITQLPFTGKAVGMGYVIRLEDGRFIVIDGGGVNSGGTEHDQIWQVLNELYKEAYGFAPTTVAPIVIAAWINTHSHWDHYYAFQQMLKKYGQTGLLRMEYMLGNFPEKTAIFAVSGSSLQMGKETTIQTMQGYVTGGFQYVKVHTGQKFHLANVTLEILMTFEDHNPRRICNSNDTCTVVRFEIANKDAPAAAPTTAIFLADAFRFQSRYLCAMYGSYLQSDIAQLAHHGNIGCEKPVYEAISPTVVFFPNAYSAYYNYTETSSSKWNFVVDRYVVKQLESVCYVYVAEKYCLTLALKASGPDFAGIYDIASGKVPLSYDGKTAVQK